MQIPYEVTARPDTGLWNAKIGIWLFLASEVMLFGGLFSGYVFLRMGITEGVDNPWPTRQLSILPGFINTLVLIWSSVCVVLAWAALKMRDFKKYQFWMRLVVLCALTFLAIKAYEYTTKFLHHGMKLEDNSVVEGVLKEADYKFKVTEIELHLDKARLTVLDYLAEGEKLPRFKTSAGVDVDLTRGWLSEARKAARETKQDTLQLTAEKPFLLSVPPRKVSSYSDTELTLARWGIRLKGELVDDQVYFEVHDIDLQMVEDDEKSMLWKYLPHPIEEEYLEYHREKMKEAEELGGRHADSKVTDIMHLHAEEHDGHHQYPVIEVPRSDVKFLSNHGPRYSTYYAIYFTLTGLHGLHVLLGALVLTYFLFFQKKLYQQNPEHLANRVEVGGLFWHFVDLVWIFLFPIMYLM